MCIHERQLLFKSFLFNNYFYFFATISRFHCDIGCSLFLSSDHTTGTYRCDLLIWRTVGNFLLGSDRADDRFQRKFFIPCNGHAWFQSGDLCCSYCCFLHSNGNDLFLAAGQCNGHFDYYLNSSPQPFHWQRANFGLTIIEHPLTDLQCCISLRYHTSCRESATPAEEILELSAGQAEW